MPNEYPFWQGRSTALLELCSADKRKQKCLQFTAILCSWSRDISMLFLLHQDAHVGIALPCSVAGESWRPHRVRQGNPLVPKGLPQLTSNTPAIIKKYTWKSGKYKERWYYCLLWSKSGGDLLPENSSNNQVSFCLERRKGGQAGSFSLPLHCPCVWTTAAMLLAFPSYPPPHALHQFFSPTKGLCAYVCVCVTRSESVGNKQILLQEALYPNYPSCGISSRP